MIVTSCSSSGGGGGGGSSSVSSGVSNQQQHLPEFLNFERNTLDYRLKNLPVIADQQNNIDYRSTSQQRNEHSKNDSEFRLSGSDFVTNNIDYSAQGSLTSSSGGGKSSRLSRNHIITDTLPGPESCV